MHKTIGIFTLGLGAIAAACSGNDDIELHAGEKLADGETPPCSVLEEQQLHGIGAFYHGPSILDRSDCTAVLIGPRTILSSAHCAKYTTVTDDPNLANFEIDPWNHCGKKRVVRVQSWVSFASSDADSPHDDLLVGLLAEPVPQGGGVRYFSIAAGYPQNGSLVTLYGRGLTDDAWQDFNWGGSLRRAQVIYDYGSELAEWLSPSHRRSASGSDHLRSGDSGGPALSASGAVFGINAATGTDDEGWVHELFADPVRLKRRTALASILNAYAAGDNWPRPAGQNGWPCADGELTFCDADQPGYVRQCAGANDLFAAQRKYCPGGCESGECKPHACDGLAPAPCVDAGCVYHVTVCSGTSYSACLPDDLVDVCSALHGETSGPGPSPGANPTSGCCAGDNLCANPPSTPGCAMTFPGGYCDPNGDGSYEDANWEKGYNQFQKQCTSSSNPPGDPPGTPTSCPCSGDNRCANPPSTPGCAMTFPGGYCDPNGDASFTDADWAKGYAEHAAECG